MGLPAVHSPMEASARFRAQRKWFSLLYRSGSTETPFTWYSKCRWGPVDLPVLPTVAMVCPASTVSPVFTRRLWQWA